LIEGQCGPIGPLFPGHGPTIQDGIARLEAYHRHRLMREGQVIEALGETGPASPEELVPHIYPDLAPFLRPVAARSVTAHLIKLEQEGRAARSDGNWSLEND